MALIIIAEICACFRWSRGTQGNTPSLVVFPKLNFLSTKADANVMLIACEHHRPVIPSLFRQLSVNYYDIGVD